MQHLVFDYHRASDVMCQAGRWAQVAKMHMQFASAARTRAVWVAGHYVASYPCRPPGFWAEADLGQKCRVICLTHLTATHSRRWPGRPVKRLHWSCAFVCLACIQADAERVTASVEAISSQFQSISSDKPKQSLLSCQVGIQCRDDYNEAPPAAEGLLSTPDVSTRLI